MERSFFSIFEDIEDPRNEKGKIYPLMDVIILALYGVLIGFEDFTNMSYYLKKHEEELTEKLELAAGVPSHDVFSALFRAIDVEAFMDCFVKYTILTTDASSVCLPCLKFFYISILNPITRSITALDFLIAAYLVCYSCKTCDHQCLTK